MANTTTVSDAELKAIAASAKKIRTDGQAQSLETIAQNTAQ